MGRQSCCLKQKLKKGLWSPEEDEKLFNHIARNGVGCWSSVPKLAGKLSWIALSSKIFLYILLRDPASDFGVGYMLDIANALLLQAYKGAERVADWDG